MSFDNPIVIDILLQKRCIGIWKIVLRFLCYGEAGGENEIAFSKYIFSPVRFLLFG